MKNKVIILGSGAAPGVPSLSDGWGVCDPYNSKNIRMRAGTYVEYNGAKILIDTSPDLRIQLLNHEIRELDAVFYTHEHADHLHGIDDLREINRVTGKSLDIYANSSTMRLIKDRYGYLLSDPSKTGKGHACPSLIPHVVESGKSFYIKEVKITPIRLLGHPADSFAYLFDGGKYLHVADCKDVPEDLYDLKPLVMVLPLTTLLENKFHMNLKEVLRTVKKIKPKKAIINHMSTECDYESLKKEVPANVLVGYDNLIVEF